MNRNDVFYHVWNAHFTFLSNLPMMHEGFFFALKSVSNVLWSSPNRAAVRCWKKLAEFLLTICTIFFRPHWAIVILSRLTKLLQTTTKMKIATQPRKRFTTLTCKRKIPFLKKQMLDATSESRQFSILFVWILKPLSVTTNVVGLQTDDADHVGQNSSAHVARVVGLQTDAKETK